MKKFSWISSSLAALAGFAAPCMAQTTPVTSASTSPAAAQTIQTVSHGGHGWPLRPCRPLSPYLPTDPSVPSTTPMTSSVDALPSETGYKSSFGMGSALSAASGIGATVATAAAGLPATTNGANINPSGNARTATVTITGTPLILPGLFSAASSQSVRPMDRVSYEYGYFDRFAVTSAGGAAPGFNLHQHNISIEKTFLDGMSSIYVSVPFLNATDNTTIQRINGLGDVNVGFKVLLFQNQVTGSAFSAGMTVAAPTARPTRYTSTGTLNMTFTGPAIPGLGIGDTIPVTPFTSTTTVNPTYLQPWVGGLVNWNRLFIHEYLGVLIPTDGRVSTFINNNLTLGVNLYDSPNGIVRSVTPVLGVQLLIPVRHRGSSAGSTTSTQAVDISCITASFAEIADQFPLTVGFPDQVFLSSGAQIGLGDRAMFTGAVVVPVAGPRGYSVGGTVGLTFFY